MEFPVSGPFPAFYCHISTCRPGPAAQPATPSGFPTPASTPTRALGLPALAHLIATAYLQAGEPPRVSTEFCTTTAQPSDSQQEQGVENPSAGSAGRSAQPQASQPPRESTECLHATAQPCYSQQEQGVETPNAGSGGESGNLLQATAAKRGIPRGGLTALPARKRTRVVPQGSVRGFVVPGQGSAGRSGDSVNPLKATAAKRGILRGGRTAYPAKKRPRMVPHGSLDGFAVTRQGSLQPVTPVSHAKALPQAGNQSLVGNIPSGTAGGQAVLPVRREESLVVEFPLGTADGQAVTPVTHDETGSQSSVRDISSGTASGQSKMSVRHDEARSQSFVIEISSKTTGGQFITPVNHDEAESLSFVVGTPSWAAGGRAVTPVRHDEAGSHIPVVDVPPGTAGGQSVMPVGHDEAPAGPLLPVQSHVTSDFTQHVDGAGTDSPLRLPLLNCVGGDRCENSATQCMDTTDVLTGVGAPANLVLEAARNDFLIMPMRTFTEVIIVPYRS